VDLLAFNTQNELDRLNSALLANELDVPILPGYASNKALGLLYYFNDDQSKITLYRAGVHTAVTTFDTGKNVTFTLNQSGQTIIQQVNKGATSTVIINQQ
jgi:hypothetical protein